MTNDNKPPLFGPTGVFDPATYEPRSGKTFWMAATDVSLLADKEDAAETVIGNCTTSFPFKFKFDSKDNGHTMIFAPTRTGMSVDYSSLGLTDAEVAEVKIIDKGTAIACHSSCKRASNPSALFVVPRQYRSRAWLDPCPRTS